MGAFRVYDVTGAPTEVLYYDSDDDGWTSIGWPTGTPASFSNFSLNAVSSSCILLAGQDSLGDAYIYLFDGSSWSSLGSVDWDTPGDGFDCVRGLSASEVWVGAQNREIWYYNGAVWTKQFTAAAIGIGYPGHSAFCCINENDVWTGGTDIGTGVPTVHHFDGVSWSKITTGLSYDAWNGVTTIWASGSNDVWFLGSQDNLGDDHVFLFHWNGASWSDQTANLLIDTTWLPVHMSGLASGSMAVTGRFVPNGPTAYNGSVWQSTYPSAPYTPARYMYRILVIDEDDYVTWRGSHIYRGGLASGWTELTSPPRTVTSMGEGFGIPPPVYPVKLPTCGLYIDEVRGVKWT